MKTVVSKYCIVLIGGSLILGCAGSKGENRPADPSRVVAPGPIGLGVGGEATASKNMEVCKMLETDGVIAHGSTDQPSKASVRVSISESDDVKFVVECPGTLIQ